jgi:hypothetical protein
MHTILALMPQFRIESLFSPSSVLFLILLLDAVQPPQAKAWGAEGHMVTAQIAYNHLDPAVRSMCDSLIAGPLTYSSANSSNFVTAACWADDFKSQLGTGGWHYVDLPFSLDGTTTNGYVYPAQSNVVYAINLCITNLLNPATTPSNQAVYLRYLIHFVGDIQQPLHSSDAISAVNPGGDGGGNGFYITGTWNNLHSLWDAGGGYLTDSVNRPLSAAAQTIISNKAVAIEADYPYTPNPGSIPDPMDWAKESWGLAQTVAYVGITRNSPPSTAYTNSAQATTEQRMAAGGHRLADLLNTLFGTDTVRLVASPTSKTNLALSWSAIPGRAYHVQWKSQLTDSVWNDLTTLTATSNSLSISEPLTPTQRFYRVTQ